MHSFGNLVLVPRARRGVGAFVRLALIAEVTDIFSTFCAVAGVKVYARLKGANPAKITDVRVLLGDLEVEAGFLLLTGPDKASVNAVSRKLEQRQTREKVVGDHVDASCCAAKGGAVFFLSE